MRELCETMSFSETRCENSYSCRVYHGSCRLYMMRALVLAALRLMQILDKYRNFPQLVALLLTVVPSPLTNV